MKVSEIIEGKERAGELLNVGAGASVADAVKEMVERDTGSCLVLDGGELKGIITFREVMALLAKDPTGCMAAPVASVMVAEPAVAKQDDTVEQIRTLMTTEHIRYLPVMKDGRLADVMSLYDIARAMAKNTELENKMLKQYISDWPEDQG